jgi:hypothetical protein
LEDCDDSIAGALAQAASRNHMHAGRQQSHAACRITAGPGYSQWGTRFRTPVKAGAAGFADWEDIYQPSFVLDLSA